MLATTREMIPSELETPSFPLENVNYWQSNFPFFFFFRRESIFTKNKPKQKPLDKHQQALGRCGSGPYCAAWFCSFPLHSAQAQQFFFSPSKAKH